jgi:pyrroline-5-carboxylate reductase
MLPPVLLIGAGRMGGAMFAGWAARGLAASVLVDPRAQPGLARPQDQVIAALTELPTGFTPGAVILAVKPQMADGVLPALTGRLPADAVVLSIMAGRPEAGMRKAIGGSIAVVRAMPNTPAAIGQGMTVAFAGPHVTLAQHALCDTLLAAVGDVAWVDDEDLMDRITAISGSGPAYVFLLAELLEQAGIAEGIPPGLARTLARRTVTGAGALLAAGDEDAADLRRAVTSAKGVTERALAVLMDDAAWPASIRGAVRAAAARARELAG